MGEKNVDVYGITAILWLMARAPPRCSYVAILILANVPSAPQISLPKKTLCRQRKELGSRCSILFPTQRK